MKTMKMALMAGAAVAVSSAVAHADELADMKAQIETLNARVAAMETAPSVPTGYQLLAISKGDALQVPGMMGSDRDRVVNDRATVISVMPTADAPAGTTISWSGYVRAAVIYGGQDGDATLKRSYSTGNAPGGPGLGPDADPVVGPYANLTKIKLSSASDDNWDVKARGQLRVVATTDTAVGEVGVELKMRADFNGNGAGTVYMKTAWGYWAMTPELTFGGGYAGSLGNIGYGYDGACTCYYTDNAGVDFDPGDTTQLRLSYASGPFSMAVALEDSGLNDGFGNDDDYVNGQNLGVAGEIKYSGDAFSGEISGVYRSVNSSDYNLSGYTSVFSASTPLYYKYEANIDSLWQVGAGVGFNLGDIASLSLAAALGSGPTNNVNSSGDIVSSYPVQNDWWGVSGLASANLSDSVHAEVGVGYKHREGDSNNSVSICAQDGDPKVADVCTTPWKYDGFDQERFAVLGGLYYTPVDQLTIGLEAEWYTVDTDLSRKTTEDFSCNSCGPDQTAWEGRGIKDSLNVSTDNWTVDLVSVWRF